MKPIALLLLFVPLWGNTQILKKEIPDKMVVLSFDDATASQYSVVAPLLKEFNFGATFFICEFQPNFSDTSKYMNWRQIKELDRMGFELANHTRTHPNVADLPKTNFLNELNYIENKFDTFAIRKPVSFAYPGYGVSIAAINTLNEKGYWFARAGGSRAYNPLKDYPLLVPSWAMNAENKAEIMAAFNEARNGKIVVLTIHGVPDVEHPWVNTPPQLFEEYLRYLHEQNFTVVAFRDLAAYINIDSAKKLIIPDLSKALRN